ncbi:MAG: hypothetical protein QM597_09755 [Aeromicrobium sp.]|uniref:hypothetical protein n=1 Tax=Aeromicrobium sp. TaxID=1871063 RepID=UPI0039E4BF9D
MIGRLAPGGAALLVTTALLAGCGGSGQGYCDVVERHRAALDDVTVTTDSLTAAASALHAIEKVAPADIGEAYTAVADSIDALLAAESVAGVPVEELTHDQVVDLSEADTEALEAAYQAFAGTADQRRLIAEDIEGACDVTLKTPAEQGSQ